jgi:hypothetical protein
MGIGHGEAGPRVRTAQSSHKYSAASWSSRRATRLSG